MVQKIRAKNVEVTTVDGECHLTITLELDLNINLNGNSYTGFNQEKKELLENSKVDDVPYQVPDFTSNKINFGKSIKEI